MDYDSEATESGIEKNNDENAPKTPCDGKNMNASSDYEGNNYNDSPDMPYDGENINAYSNNEGKMMRLSPIHLQMT